MYLLDTNVVSEVRRPKPHGAVLAWLEATPAVDLFISAVTLGELQAGIEITRQQDPAKAAALERWVDLIPGQFKPIPMTGDIFRLWSRLMLRQSDSLMMDAMIAATASVHGFTVVTRDTRDFAPFRVPTLNPFRA